MIAELLKVADAWHTGRLTGHEPFGGRGVDYFIDLDSDGRVLLVSPCCANREGHSKRFPIPINYRLGSQNVWIPLFLTGKAAEVFAMGVTGQNPTPERHAKWAALIRQAAAALPNNLLLRTVQRFIEGRTALADCPLEVSGAAERQQLLKACADGIPTLSFRVNGRIVIRDQELREWWAEHVKSQRDAVVKGLRRGEDAFLPGEGPLADSFPVILGNVPVLSFDKAPYKSYGLGAQTATLRLDTAEMYAAALNALWYDQTHSQRMEQFGKKELRAVFWAVSRGGSGLLDASFLHLVQEPDPLAVRDYINSVWAGRAREIPPADFHCALLMKGTGRFQVRSWHTETLAEAERHVRAYFDAIDLPSLPDWPELDPVRLSDLAWATIGRAKGKQKAKPPAATYSALFDSAWRGTAVPHPIFAAAIERQRTEMAGGDSQTQEFWGRVRARAALVQLYFTLNNGTATDEEAIMDSKETAILCGRLLALLDGIHNKAHDGKSASSPANTLYGAAAATPALVFPRLCTLARYHLQKMDEGMARKWEYGVPRAKRDDGVDEDFDGLAAVVARLKGASGGEFPRMLSLEEQGRFALGFYYERARKWPNYKKSDDTTPEDNARGDEE